MKILRCSKPGCGNTYCEGTPEFEDGFCSCGAALVEVTEDTAIKSVDEIINGESTTPRFEYEVYEEKYSENEQEEVEVLDDSETLFGNFEDKEEQEVAVQNEIRNETTPVELALDNKEEVEDDGFPKYLVGKKNEIVFKQDKSYQAVYEDLVEQGYFGDPHSNYEGDRIQLILDGRVLRTYPLEYDEMLIGREHDGVIPEIDYTNIDGERFISRRHALIYRQQNEYFIRNLSTKNSLHVNKEVVLEKEFRCLQDGDKIVLSRKYGLVFKKKSESEHI